MEPVSGERAGEPDPQLIDLNYSRSADTSVRLRFETYRYAVPYVNLDRLAIDTLFRLNKLPTDAVIVDTGAADGILGTILNVDYEHQSNYLGVERNANQFPDYSSLSLTPAEWRELSINNLDLSLDVDQIIELQATQDVPLWSPTAILQLRQGNAQELASLVEAQSVDVLFAMFMLYHLPTAERYQALEAFQRVLKPDGVVVIATSGQQNKWKHRRFEQEISGVLSTPEQIIQAPPYMNAGFTSEVAEQELVKFFPYVYMYHQHSEMRIDSATAINSYIKSVRSLRNQFRPEPDEDKFEKALIDNVALPIINQWLKEGSFVDYVHRSLALCSNTPLEIGDPETTQFYPCT